MEKENNHMETEKMLKEVNQKEGQTAILNRMKYVMNFEDIDISYQFSLN